MPRPTAGPIASVRMAQAGRVSATVGEGVVMQTAQRALQMPVFGQCSLQKAQGESSKAATSHTRQPATGQFYYGTAQIIASPRRRHWPRGDGRGEAPDRLAECAGHRQ